MLKEELSVVPMALRQLHHVLLAEAVMSFYLADPVDHVAAILPIQATQR